MNDKMEELLAGIRGALGQYYSDADKYGEGYAASDLLAYLERVSDYNGEN